MNFKKIYGLILGVIAAGLTSCSSDLNNEEKAPVGPNETAVRSLSIATGDAKTLRLNTTSSYQRYLMQKHHLQ